ncbi:MAG: glycosyltransferase, partial [Trichodesmium sp. MO_231.B1]|nr:glycosyltransferase [Trichodesmium sp. MO_231.B1]
LGNQISTAKKISTKPVVEVNNLSGLGDKSSTKPVVEVNNLSGLGDKSSTKPVVEVNNLPELGNQISTAKKISTKPVVEVNNLSGLGDKSSTKPVVEVNNLSGLGNQTSTTKKISTKPVVEVNNLSGLGNQTSTTKKISTKPVVEVNNLSELANQTSTAKKISTKPVVEVNNLSELANQISTQQKQELLGLSGVTIEKLWEIINPVILMEGRRKKEEGRVDFSEFSLEGKINREERRRDFSQPSMSILTPTWNSSLDWFVETVLSVLNQSIPDWEWCIVDDGSKQSEIRNVLAGLAEKESRIKVLFSEDNGGISAATNKALNMATGEFICLLDHDDTLAPIALENSLDKLAEGFDVVYSDEDKIDFSGLNYIHPFFKPDWSPEYFRGVMYVGHLLCVRREIALAAGGFKTEFDGVQDYEFMLRVSEQTNKIAHISKHLYHWRQVKGSISGDADAKAGIEVVQQAAVNAHLERIGLAAKAEPGLGKHRVNINPLPRKIYPLISLIIATSNISESLGQWLANFLSVSTYPKNEVILIGGNGTENLIENPAVKVLSLSGKFNYSRAYNLAAKTAQGEYFVFLNTNLEPAVEDWQRHLLYYAEQSDIGAVGGFLVFPNGTVEHAGIVLGKSGKVNYVMRGFSTDDDGYAGSLVCAREVSAVSRDCLMVRRENFELVGGFNEHFFSDYHDIDLCLKLRKKGRRIVFTPRSVLINRESEKHRQENYDVVDYMLLLDQWQIDMDLGDSYYNLNFDIQQNNYSVVV